MTNLLTAAQMSGLEKAAIDSADVTGLALMEQAGRGVVDAIFAEWPDLAQTSHRAMVLCGPGNNGGDGFVVARLLAQWGWKIAVFLFGEVEKLPPDARKNHDRWCQIGAVTALDDRAFADDVRDHGSPALVLDALLGTGLSRGFLDLPALRQQLADWRAETSGARIVAVDIPTGLCADSGRYPALEEECDPAAIKAHLTVSFHAAKLGHYLGQGPYACGKTVVADIGLRQADSSDHVALIASPSRSASLTKPAGHKFDNGHAFVLTGGPGRTGAARLAARGALRIGAGLVTLGVPPAAQLEVASQITAVMLARVADGDALARTLKDERITALCLGPGLGIDRARDLVPVALGLGDTAPRATVLDADALSAFAEDPEELFCLLHKTCVLTPHLGEFARLFPDIAARLKACATKGPAYSKVDATRAAAARAGCVVLLKGPDTVIADATGRCCLHAAAYGRAAPWLATAGSGDVLAGLITGLLARGAPPLRAAADANWIHTTCALTFGPGLIAEDLPEQVPGVLRGWLLEEGIE